MIEEYDVSTGLWKIFPVNLKKPRSGLTSLVYKEKIYVCGGNDGSTSRSFECLDTKQRKHYSMPDMKIRREEHALTLGPDKKIYALGGIGGIDKYAP